MEDFNHEGHRTVILTELAMVVVISDEISKSTKRSSEIYRTNNWSTFDEIQEGRNGMSENISLLFVARLVAHLSESRGEIAGLLVVGFEV